MGRLDNDCSSSIVINYTSVCRINHSSSPSDCSIDYFHGKVEEHDKGTFLASPPPPLYCSNIIMALLSPLRTSAIR